MMSLTLSLSLLASLHISVLSFARHEEWDYFIVCSTWCVSPASHHNTCTDTHTLAHQLKMQPFLSFQLDIYKEPEEVQYEVTMEEPTALEENVSKVRKVVWKYKDDVKVCGFCDSNFSNDICCSETSFNM